MYGANGSLQADRPDVVTPVADGKLTTAGAAVAIRTYRSPGLHVSVAPVGAQQRTKPGSLIAHRRYAAGIRHVRKRQGLMAERPL